VKLRAIFVTANAGAAIRHAAVAVTKSARSFTVVLLF